MKPYVCIIGGLFAIAASTAVLTPLASIATPKPTPSPFYETPFVVGDCNGDGKVQQEEWMLCWMIESRSTGASGLSPCSACDADGNGVVTVEEAQWASWNGGVRTIDQ